MVLSRKNITGPFKKPLKMCELGKSLIPSALQKIYLTTCMERLEGRKLEAGEGSVCGCAELTQPDGLRE